MSSTNKPIEAKAENLLPMDSYQNCYMLCQCKTPNKKTKQILNKILSAQQMQVLLLVFFVFFFKSHSPSASGLCLCNFGLFSMSVFGFLRLPSYRFTSTSKWTSKGNVQWQTSSSIDIKVFVEVNIMQQTRKCTNWFKFQGPIYFSKKKKSLAKQHRGK